MNLFNPCIPKKIKEEKATKNYCNDRKSANYKILD